MRPGRIILLNGASSSGKSALAKLLGEGRTQVTVDGSHTFGPYDYDVDTTGGVSPSWRPPSGPRGAAGRAVRRY